MPRTASHLSASTTSAPSFEALLQRPGLAWMGQNTTHLEPPPEVVRALLDSTRQHEFQFYAPALGFTELRELIVADLGLAGSTAMITDGAAGGLHHICTALAPGLSRLITTDPGWPWPGRFAELEGVPVTAVPVYSAEAGYKLSAAALADVIEPAALLYLIDPLNPLGSSYDRDELEAIVGVARARGAIIVHDCTYRHFADGHTLAASLYPEATLTTYSFSKWLGLAGLRLGAVVGRPELLDRLIATPSNPLGANIQAQRAAIAGLKVKDPWLDRLRQVNRRNQQIVIEAVQRSCIGRVLVDPSQGNFLAIDVSGQGWTADQVCAALLERDVFIRSGRYQSPAFGERFVKVSTSVPTAWAQRFAAAWARLDPSGPGVGRAAVTELSRFAALDVEEYQAATALDLAQRVAGGSVSPVQLTECALHIAGEAEPVINGYASLLPERALREAAELEAEARSGRTRGRLHGVPIAVKDNFYYEGEPTWKGSLTSSDEPAPVSAPMVARLTAAGAIVIGKTTTPEFGWKGTGISPRTGVTRNPWDPARNPGGSSAGSAATVASGAVPVAVGTDGGGSIRIPASFCGVVGFKPTLGAIPVWPGTVNETLSHAGPLTRSVADARAVFALTRGPDARDPQSFFPAPLADPPGRRWRVGVVREPFGVAPDTAVAAVFGRACELVRSAGLAEIGDIADLGAPLPRDVFEAMWVTGRGLGYAGLIRGRGDVMDPGLVRLGPLAERYSLAGYYRAMGARRAFNERMFGLFEDWDLLLMPTMPGTAFAADAEVPPGGEAGALLPWITWTPYTYPFNITGQPAISIPCGLAAGNLPAGLQIVGPWAHDDRVLDFAESCERALGPLGQDRVAPWRRHRSASTGN